MRATSNLAYDYERFEEQKKPKISTVKKQVKHKNPAILAKAVGCIMVVVVALSAFIYTRVVQAELSLDYNAAVKQLEALENENVHLQIRFEQEFSTDRIEEIARDQLNMQELDNSKVEYIEMDNHDEVAIVQELNFFETMSRWISGLFE